MYFHAARPFAPSVSVLLCCAWLSGCKLIDQRTFDRNADRVPVSHLHLPVAQGPAPIPPLFVVHGGGSDEDWQPDLRAAVAEALARKPNALFTVQSVVPPASSPAAQAAALQTATAGIGRSVADALDADGARPAQIEMSAASDPAVKTPEVRIFVR
jgi:hypothetical protein